MARIKHGSLANSQVDVTLDANYRFVEVLMRSGSTDLWAVADPTAAGSIASGDDVDVVPGTGGSVILESRSSAAETVVRLESTGTVQFSVKGLEA